jgi:hypothetical protein
MVIEYESQSIFRLVKSNSGSGYDTLPSEYDSIKVPLTTVWTNEIAAIFRSYDKTTYKYTCICGHQLHSRIGCEKKNISKKILEFPANSQFPSTLLRYMSIFYSSANHETVR